MATGFNLSELIRESAPAQVGQKGGDFQLLPLEQLVENEKNSLFPIGGDELDELTNSIHAVGLTEPLTVTPMGEGRYRIISGHRRSRALRALAAQYTEDERWKTAPCYVRHYRTQEDEELALIFANTQVRKDKSWMRPAIERVRALLMKKAERDGVKYRGKLQGEIAQILQISRQELQRQEYIAEHLVPEVRERWGNLPTQTANTIAHMSPSLQRKLAKRFPEWMGTPTNWNAIEINDSSKRGNDWFDIQESLHDRRQALEAEEERKKEERRKAAEERKAERKKRDNDYRTELALKTLGMEVEPREKPAPTAPTINWGYDDKLIMERFKTAREMAKAEKQNTIETSGYGNISDILEAVREYHCSADYLLGLADEPNPAPKAPEWKLIAPNSQPPTDRAVEIITWLEDKWFRGRMKWSEAMLENHDIMMWMECVPLPPPPDVEDEELETMF